MGAVACPRHAALAVTVSRPFTPKIGETHPSAHALTSYRLADTSHHPYALTQTLEAAVGAVVNPQHAAQAVAVSQYV